MEKHSLRRVLLFVYSESLLSHIKLIIASFQKLYVNLYLPKFPKKLSHGYTWVINHAYWTCCPSTLAHDPKLWSQTQALWLMPALVLLCLSVCHVRAAILYSPCLPVRTHCWFSPVQQLRLDLIFLHWIDLCCHVPPDKYRYRMIWNFLFIFFGHITQPDGGYLLFGWGCCQLATCPEDVCLMKPIEKMLCMVKFEKDLFNSLMLSYAQGWIDLIKIWLKKTLIF